MGAFDFSTAGDDPGPPASLPTAIREEADRIIRETPMVDSPAEVNGGYCKALALRAGRRAVKAGEKPLRLHRGWQGIGSRHFYLESPTGTFHDAERPDGVPEARMLPFFGGVQPHDVVVINVLR